jgi:hypothetical protein
VLPWITTGFLEHHDVFLKAEHEIDMSRDLDSIPSGERLASIQEWHTLRLTNPADTILAPPFKTGADLQGFEESLGLRFLLLSHFARPDHDVDFVADTQCLPSIKLADGGDSAEAYHFSLPRVLGRCIRLNALGPDRPADAAAAGEGPPAGPSPDPDPDYYWYCSPCRDSQTWPWGPDSPLAATAQHFPPHAALAGRRRPARRAADAYHAHFRRALAAAPHACGAAVRGGAVAKGLFFLARELAACLHAGRGFRQVGAGVIHQYLTSI